MVRRFIQYLIFGSIFVTGSYVLVFYSVTTPERQSIMVTHEVAGFPWYECHQDIIDRVIRGVANYEGIPRTTLSITIKPEEYDNRLFSSTLVIKASNMGGPNAPPMYQGPFQHHLTLTDIPYNPKRTLVELTIWAFHNESGTCMNWSSKNSTRLFGIGAIVIELFKNFNREADAWYRVYPAKKIEDTHQNLG